jgi:hypothetical protein
VGAAARRLVELQHLPPASASTMVRQPWPVGDAAGQRVEARQPAGCSSSERAMLCSTLAVARNSESSAEAMARETARGRLLGVALAFAGEVGQDHAGHQRQRQQTACRQQEQPKAQRSGRAHRCLIT